MAQTSSLKAQERRRKFKQRAYARRRLRELRATPPPTATTTGEG